MWRQRAEPVTCFLMWMAHPILEFIADTFGLRGTKKV